MIKNCSKSAKKCIHLSIKKIPKNPIFRGGIEYFGMGFQTWDGIQFLKISGWDAKNPGIFGTGWDGTGMGSNTTKNIRKT